MSLKSRSCSLFLTALFLVACFAFPATGQPASPRGAVFSAPEKGGGDPADCAGGVVVDDGSAETGYGWVPSVIEGEYVQEFDTGDFTSRRLRSVCVCWLRTRPDQTIDFEVVFYRQVTDPENAERLIPAAEPYAAFPASAEVLPEGITESFFEVYVGDMAIPVGQSYIGARWDASADQFFFICADTTESTEPVDVYFRDDRAEGEWVSVFESNDPIFDDHRALMVRALPGPVAAVDVPVLGGLGLVLLAVTLSTLALAKLARRRAMP